MNRRVVSSLSNLHIIFSYILYFSSFTVLLLEAGYYFTFSCKKITRKGQMVGVAYLEAVLWVALLYHDRLPTVEKGTLKHRLQKLSTLLVPQSVKRTTTKKNNQQTKTKQKKYIIPLWTHVGEVLFSNMIFHRNFTWRKFPATTTAC